MPMAAPAAIAAGASVAGAAASSALNKGGGGGGKMVQTTEPWWGQKQALLQLIDKAKWQMETPLEYFPGQTYADFAPETQQALNLTTNRALAGSPLTKSAAGAIPGLIGGIGPGMDYMTQAGSTSNAALPFLSTLGSANSEAQGYLRPTARGDFLDVSANNPVYSRLASDIAGRVAGQFGQTPGGLGSGAFANTFRDSLTDMGTRLYENERQRQLGAAESIGQQQLAGAGQLAGVSGQDLARRLAAGQGLLGAGQFGIGQAPVLAAQDYIDLDQLMSVGGLRQAQEQQAIDAAKARWDFAQMEPWQRMQLALPIIGGNYGGQQTQTQSGGGGGGVGQYAGSGMMGIAALLPFLKGMGGGGYSANDASSAARAALMGSTGYR